MKVLAISMMALMCLAVVEVVSCAGADVLVKRGLWYAPQSLDGYDDYMAMRDPLLGWPPRTKFGGDEFDARGARNGPAFPETDPACVSVYGDSFTYGDGVTDEDAWANRLSMRLGCRVANYGVGGYGTDQALLRFEQNLADEAPVVALFHLTENIMRNVNRVRGALYGSTRWGMKPRFIVDEGELVLVPILDLSRDDLARALDDPGEHIPHEYFAAGGASGKPAGRFPYSWGLLRAVGHFHVRAKLAGRPWFGEFYGRDHLSGGLEVTARVLERFTREARARGKRPLLFVIPTGLDLLYLRDKGAWVHTPLLERSAALELEVIDLSPLLEASLEGGDPCTLFHSCSGHLNARGNDELSALIHRELVARSVAEPDAVDSGRP